MNILAIDTSSTVATVAVITEEKLLGEIIINHPKTHSQKLMPVLDQLLMDLDMSVKDMDRIAVANGPGSFTGVRIGLSAAKGLAHPNEIPLIQVSSLEGLAYNLVGCNHYVCSLFDARRDQVYAAIYKNDWDSMALVSEEMNCSIHQLMDEFDNLEGDVIFLGDGIPKYKTIIEEKLGSRGHFAPPSISMQRASSIGLAALRKGDDATLKYDQLTANYLRKSEAERTYEEKQLKNQTE